MNKQKSIDWSSVHISISSKYKSQIARWYVYWWYLVPTMDAYMNNYRTEVLIIHIYISLIRTDALTRYMWGGIIRTNGQTVYHICWIHNKLTTWAHIIRIIEILLYLCLLLYHKEAYIINHYLYEMNNANHHLNSEIHFIELRWFF